MIDAHPALVAVSPQAPVTDYYMGDDVLSQRRVHAGAPLQFLYGIPRSRRRTRRRRKPTAPFQFGTPDGYDFYLQMGSLANADEKYFKRKQPLWNLNIDHTTYDDVWQSRAIWKYLKNIKPAVMLVGGWYDTEDPQGLLRQHEFMEKNWPARRRHAGDGAVESRRLCARRRRPPGQRQFRLEDRDCITARRSSSRFSSIYLKGRGDGKFPRA